MTQKSLKPISPPKRGAGKPKKKPTGFKKGKLVAIFFKRYGGAI